MQLHINPPPTLKLLIHPLPILQKAILATSITLLPALNKDLQRQVICLTATQHQIIVF
ncbi:hypothetical protein MXB_3531 [Myxobolus squamalis]|nr:hypothetical protein MXB_3531 [Myxobolus squamalis]